MNALAISLLETHIKAQDKRLQGRAGTQHLCLASISLFFQPSLLDMFHATVPIIGED